MDLKGFFKTGNPDYFFSPSGEYQTRTDVNAHQTALVQAQTLSGRLTRLESDSMIAEINNTTLDSVSNLDRPSTVFVSEMTTDFNKKFRNSFSDILTEPFRLIPPVAWVFLFIGVLIYIELMTGVFTRKLKSA